MKYLLLNICIWLSTGCYAHIRCNIINKTDTPFHIALLRPDGSFAQKRAVQPKEAVVWRHHTHRSYVLAFFHPNKSVQLLTSNQMQHLINQQLNG